MGKRITASVATENARKKNLFVHALRGAPAITYRFQPAHNIKFVELTQAFADVVEINWALGGKTKLRDDF